MISLQQQQKPAELILTSWKYDGEHSPPSAATLASSSLGCALETSMKVWQPINNGQQPTGVVMGGLHEKLGNALNMTWLDWTKPVPACVQGTASDEHSVSSSSASGGGGSRGASRTPSPFGHPVSSSVSSGSASAISVPGHTLPPGAGQAQKGHGSYGAACPLPCSAEGFVSGGGGGGGAEVPLRRPGQAETYSRKVFVGGLPPDIDQDEIKEHFIRYGPLAVDWPHKAQSKAYFPPKGYAFLLFRDEISVHRLVKMCVAEEGKLFMFVSSVTQTHKKVQIRPWKLSDSDFIMDHTQPIDPRKTIFIGGVPRPLKAAELADIFNSRYGNVCYAGIDCDPELKYPKGAGRVTFSSRVSFMSAVSCRFLQVTYGDIDKKVEVKPYVLDDQTCDECQGLHCGGRYAPYFCGNIHCLRYYCEHCWSAIHSAPGTQNHRCFIKENGDRPRAINFFPSQPRVTLS